jgi:hypothetical protein
MSGCKTCVWDIYTDDFNNSISGLELLLSSKMDKGKRKEIVEFIQTAELELVDPVRAWFNFQSIQAFIDLEKKMKAKRIEKEVNTHVSDN